MKKFLSMLAIAAMVTSFVACDDDPTAPDGPTITPPAVTNIQVSTAADITFATNVPGGYKSATVTATGGTATIKSAPAAGTTSGNVVVTYTADASAGAGTATITVTDNNDKTATQTGAANKTAEPVVPTEIEVTANVTENTTWETGKTYILATRVAVLDGITLTIEPGVVVKGQAGTGANATALLIARGGKLMAEGTEDSPIIFTSVADEIEPGQIVSPNIDPDVNGLWGGVIVLGNAPISASNENDQDVTEVQIEGIPTSDPNGLYGGDNKEDNSGVIKYISIRHGGANIGSGNEINGLTLGGVGSATVVDHVEVVANQDDGIELFGGTVSVTNVLVWNSFDDGLDTDQAWNGTIDNFVIVAPNTGSGFELDGPEGSYFDGNQTIINGTVYAGPNIADLIDFDATTQVDMENIYFFGITNNTSVTEYVAMAAGGGSVANFEHTLDGKDPAVVFLGIPAGALTAVALEANTVGADASVFGWTWASQSGALAEAGVE